jgi:pyrimidine operon attenuation protein/uracil phosphoribosyltransferase
MTQEKQILFERDELVRTVNRMAHEIIEQTASPSELVLIGIRSRGVHLARRLARKVEEVTKTAPPVGVIDITPYRDDRAREQDPRAVGAFEIPSTWMKKP